MGHTVTLHTLLLCGKIATSLALKVLDTGRLQGMWYRKKLSFQVPAFPIHRLLIHTLPLSCCN